MREKGTKTKPQRLGVECHNYLISVSGRKGWHIDLFFAELVSKALIQEFYKIILAETGLNDQQVELFGGNAKGYKLPFGIHCETGKKCAAVDEFKIGLAMIVVDALMCLFLYGGGHC